MQPDTFVKYIIVKNPTPSLFVRPCLIQIVICCRSCFLTRPFFPSDLVTTLLRSTRKGGNFRLR